MNYLTGAAPYERENAMANSDIAPHKSQLQQYFNGVGFERWSAIYGQVPLSFIRRTVREGHERMLAQAEAWLLESRQSGTVLDAGCGTGLFSVMLARRGFTVTAVDIAPRMVEEARANAVKAGVAERIDFRVGDAESAAGQFDAVVCFDVLVHYPLEPFTHLCHFLAERCDGTLIITYAPYNRLLAFMHWVGGHFPRRHRRTEIQMTPDSVVAGALAAAGMQVKRTMNVYHGFYHVRLLEAARNP